MTIDPVELAGKVTDKLSGWYALPPDFGNPEVVKFGAESVVAGIRMFGWDAVYFDGIYALSSTDMTYNQTKTYLWNGSPPGRDRGDGAVSEACVRKVREIIRASYPDIPLWYNSGKRFLPKNTLYNSTIVSLQDTNCGALMEIQGGEINYPGNPNHQWRILYETYIENRDDLAKIKGVEEVVRCNGYLFNIDNWTKVISKEEFAASRIYGRPPTMLALYK